MNKHKQPELVLCSAEKEKTKSLVNQQKMLQRVDRHFQYDVHPLAYHCTYSPRFGVCPGNMPIVGKPRRDAPVGCSSAYALDSHR